MAPVVRYRVSMSRPHSHLFEVEATFPAIPGSLTVALPVWTPGSYLVREYARHLQQLSAWTVEGTPLIATRIDKRSFRIESGGQPVQLRYKVYANELTVRTSHLDGSHGYFNGASMFLYSEALREAEHRVRIEPPPGWTPFAALPRQGQEFVAPHYDDLIDSPFEVGPHTPLSFTVAGVPHLILLWGEPALDHQRLIADLSRICETEAHMFGGLPMDQYLFIVHCTDKGRGGLEHKASTTLLYPRSGFTTSKGWEDFLTLAAHEYFHLWNVKRIKPKALVPFDYSQENYTSLLWAFEGVTSYYDNMILRRAGLMSAGRYLTRMGETLSVLYATPGRRLLRLEDASLMAWIKHYRPDESSGNTAISYYLKGEVVALLLDLQIRRATKDEKSLDDVMRLLWHRHGDESGVSEDGVEAAAIEVAGEDLRPFFDRAIRSTEELDLSVLSHVGLEAQFRERESPTDKGGTPPRAKEPRPRGWLGAATRGSSTIASVVDGSPAMEAGLYADDELVAVDGYRCEAAGLLARCEDKRPGESVRLTIFRRDRLVELNVTLGSKPLDAVFLSRVPAPTEQQRRSYAAWLMTPWEESADGR